MSSLRDPQMTPSVSVPERGEDAVHPIARAPIQDAGRALQTQQQSRELIARMREPAPKQARDLDARGLIRHDMRDARQADVFRDLRTQLLASARGRNFVVLVAGVSSGCGGSYVAANLAAAFAFDESKTALLIDCNLRRPVLHLRLGVQPESGGLTDFLDHPSTGVEHIIYPTGVARLRLIPAGSRREAATEYFTSYRMRGLIDSLRSRYPDRFLVLDAPPITHSPDARILSELADMSLVVAAYGHDTAAVIKDAVAVLEPARLAGVVFNRVP
jgi:capsular exopolysaccharide synthesis family protein